MDPQQDARTRMVAEQIRGRGVQSERVLEAMRRVPRHRFVPAEHLDEAYDDHPITIGFGQTISQPYIVAFMTEALELEPDHRVLDVGTGSGYQTAVLAELVAEVFTIELIPELAGRARQTLADLGYHNVHVRTGDGYAGWPEHAPYDRIVAGAAAPDDIPQPLLDQLVDGGIIAIPTGTWSQELHVIRKRGDRLETLTTLPVRFVPLVRG
jgi:protein-L-isoaspartate(D-aspartate) O-methyltransferase